MENIGYESNNCLQNLGTLYFILVFYAMQVILTMLLYLFFKCTGRCKQRLKNNVKRLFFTEILVISIESIIEFYISGYLQV
jgi:hypothetical protein